MKIEDAIAESKAFKKVAKILYDKSTRCRFYEKLAALIDNGKQMQLSIENLQERASKKSKTDAEAIVLKDVYLKIQQGASLGDALAEYIPMGERMLIMAGEQSGTLPQALNMCAELIKASQKMLGRVLAAIAQPLILGAVLACALLVISKSVVPKLEMVYPAEHWEGAARNLYLVASFVDTPWFLVLLGFLFIFFVTIAVTLPYWKGRIRPFFDKIPPWSFYRLQTGAAFSFAVVEIGRAGGTLNISTLDKMATYGSLYSKSHVRRIADAMRAGKTFEEAFAIDAGFPDPELNALMRALASQPRTLEKFSTYVDRWIADAEKLLKQKSAAINAALMIMVTVVIGAVLSSIFGIMNAVQSGM